MRKFFLLVSTFLLAGAAFAQNVKIDAEDAKKSYGEKVTVTPMDKTVSITKNTITLNPAKEESEYTISGYFAGQIINKKKGTVIKLDKAFIENTSGNAAIYGEAKTEISAAKDTVNYIVSSGTSKDKTAALQCKKNLVIGGSGTLYIDGKTYHAVKADDVKIKGSGTFYFEGTDKGSAVNCENFTVEKDKSFKAYFINSKNGVKADNTISISSGDLYFYNNKTALKTDTKKDNPEDAKAKYEITLAGGTIHIKSNKKLYSTEEDAYKVTGAKIVEE